MKAVYMEKPWSIAIKDIAEPVPMDGEAVIKLHAAGICGSDIGAFRGVNNLVSYPRVIGHELSAEIISVPENNKKGLKPGDHVVVDPYIYCGKCYPCSIGRTNCPELLGTSDSGLFLCWRGFAAILRLPPFVDCDARPVYQIRPK